jgi:hypothetical protein
LQYHTDGGDPISNSNPTGNNLGTIQAAVFWAGNSSVYSTINSTAFSGTASYANASVTNTFTVGTASYFVANGNLGVGTSSPSEILHVVSGDPTVLIENSVAASNSRLKLKNPSRIWQLAVRGADLSDAFVIRDETGGGDRFTISPTGNVGISNTAPVHKFRVDGDVSLSGGLHANGSLGSNGQVLSSNGTTAYWSALAKLSRVSSTTSITSPLAWNSDNYDTYITTAQAEALTINADAGTPSDGQKIIFRFKDNGTARALTFTTGVSKGFRAIGTTLPTTTTANKVLYVGCIYNAGDSRWDVIATGEEA